MSALDCILIAAFALPPVVGAGALTPNAVTAYGDPFTREDSAGSWRLDVDWIARSAHRGAHYRLSQSGEVRWEGTLPWALGDAVVTRRGEAYGYAYLRDPSVADGVLLAALRLDVDGMARPLAVTPYKSPIGPGSAPLGPLVDRIRFDHDEAYVTYDLSGQRRSSGTLAAMGSGTWSWSFHALDGQVVADEPLLPPNWAERTWRIEPASFPMRRAVVAIDFEGAPVVDLPPLEPLVLDLTRPSRPPPEVTSAWVDPRGGVHLLDAATRRVWSWSTERNRPHLTHTADVGEQFVRGGTSFAAWGSAGVLVQDGAGHIVDVLGSTTVERACASGLGRDPEWIVPTDEPGTWLVSLRGEVATLDAFGERREWNMRRSDGSRINDPRVPHRTADGTWLLLEPRPQRRGFLHLFAAAGSVRETWSLSTVPHDGLAFTERGGEVAWLQSVPTHAIPAPSLVVVDRRTHRACRVPLNTVGHGSVACHAQFVRDGRELWVFESRSPIVQRFAVPDGPLVP